MNKISLIFFLSILFFLSVNSQSVMMNFCKGSLRRKRRQEMKMNENSHNHTDLNTTAYSTQYTSRNSTNGASSRYINWTLTIFCISATMGYFYLSV
jgi:hypothetical protein